MDGIFLGGDYLTFCRSFATIHVRIGACIKLYRFGTPKNLTPPHHHTFLTKNKNVISMT